MRAATIECSGTVRLTRAVAVALSLALGGAALGSGHAHATDAKELWPTTFVIGDPMYDGIRRSARFRVLLHRVGLDEYAPSLTR